MKYKLCHFIKMHDELNIHRRPREYHYFVKDYHPPMVGSVFHVFMESFNPGEFFQQEMILVSVSEGLPVDESNIHHVCGSNDIAIKADSEELNRSQLEYDMQIMFYAYVEKEKVYGSHLWQYLVNKFKNSSGQ